MKGGGGWSAMLAWKPAAMQNALGTNRLGWPATADLSCAAGRLWRLPQQLV